MKPTNRQLAEQIFVRLLCDEADTHVLAQANESECAGVIHERQSPTWINDRGSVIDLAREAIAAAEAFNEAWAEDLGE